MNANDYRIRYAADKIGRGAMIDPDHEVIVAIADDGTAIRGDARDYCEHPSVTGAVDLATCNVCGRMVRTPAADDHRSTKSGNRVMWVLSDVLDPEAIVCNSCGCAVHDDERANQPEEGCGSLVCDCHQAYWDQLDELDKRWLWGDR